MAFNAKCPPLRAIVEQNLADQKGRGEMTLEAEVVASGQEPERFKTIRVQQVDVDVCDKSASNCFTARAIRRELKKPAAEYIAVWSDKVKIGDSVYALPTEATAADSAYSRDLKLPQLPFVFQLSNRKVNP